MGAQERELRRQLDWLMTFRVVIITTLMVSTFVIELMYRPLLSLQPFYVLAVVTYAMTIAYAILSRTVRRDRAQGACQDRIGDRHGVGDDRLCDPVTHPARGPAADL